MAEQKGLCASCKNNPATELDHCHRSGQFRGILCQPCNLIVGWLDRLPPGGIERVKEYIAR